MTFAFFVEVVNCTSCPEPHKAVRMLFKFPEEEIEVQLPLDSATAVAEDIFKAILAASNPQ